MANVTPFQISVPDSEISHLRQKLALTRLPQGTAFSGDWKYGVPVEHLSRLVKYWQDGYDWKKHEKGLNEELPQFETKVKVEGFDDVDMHFVHQRSERPDAVPLLFVHGWPGSFIEVSKVLPFLTNPPQGKPAFHVVAPSLPNFGFSGLVLRKDFSVDNYAEAVHQVMLTLGYSQYVTQGGDWGSHITRVLSHLHPEASLAHHVNLIPAPEDPPSALASTVAAVTEPAQNKEEKERREWFLFDGYGYNLLQGTKPHTIGASLSDSPSGLLAWIYEKLHDWTDDYPWTDDEILTWVSIYWFSRAGPDAASRIYYESKHTRTDVFAMRGQAAASRCPVGLSFFPKELALPPRSDARRLGNIVLEKTHDKGGHFAAWEVPEALVGDLWEMFGPGGGASHVVEELARK